MITVSAPGKLLLLGEHAVVYGYPCLVTAIDTRLTVTVEETVAPGNIVTTPGNGNHSFLTRTVEYARSLWSLPHGLSITTNSSFSGKYGFGSSSAVTVATLQALAKIAKVSLTQTELFTHCYQIVLDVQKVGSGFDIASAIFGGTIFFQNKGAVLSHITHPPYTLVIGYTGIKANTVKIVTDVAEKKEKNPHKVEKIFQEIGKLVLQAKNTMEAGEYEQFGKLMNQNQEYLRDLGVSSEKLEALISAARVAGAWGAKLSGAGGGDCMIALCSPSCKEQVVHALTRAGGEVISIAADAQGVTVTTDDQREEFVVVDRSDRIIGYKSRQECHGNKRIIHRAVGLIIFDDQKRVLLQKRSMTKDTRPGYWSTSVGGHVMKGESYEQAIMREMKEELGINLPIHYIGTFINEYSNETEMNALFTAQFNGPFTCNLQEIEAVDFFSRDQLISRMKDSSFLLSEAAIFDLRVITFIS